MSHRSLIVPVVLVSALTGLAFPASPAAAQSSAPAAFDAYLKASNTDLGDHFGSTAALSGNTLVIGAPMEASRIAGVNGNQADNNSPDAGAAYVFVRDDVTGAWSQQAYLKASNVDEGGDRFGGAVAISGDTIVVGAKFEDSDASGVNGPQNNNDSHFSGAAYVFVRNGTTWTQQAYLKASQPEDFDEFGHAVAISGDLIAVGAPVEDSAAVGVDGDQLGNGAFNSGAVYVFQRAGTTWSQKAYIKASNTGVSQYFGWAVALSGETLAVAARGEQSAATGVDGDQSLDNVFDAGAAYVFARTDGVWSQQAYVKASNTEAGDDFGWSLALHDDTLVVGARDEGSGSTGVNGAQDNNDIPFSGAAYVYARDGETWSQQAYLKASITEAGDTFGTRVAVHGDFLAVAAHGDDSSATGIDGDQTDGAAATSGAVHLFRRSGTTWSQVAYLKASNTDAGDNFGEAL